MKTKLNLEMAINIIASEGKKFEKVIKRKILCFSSTHKRNDDYCEGFFSFLFSLRFRKNIFLFV